MGFKGLVAALLLACAVAENKCGTSYSTSGCGNLCPKGLDSECPSGQRCYADAPVCSTSPATTPYPTLFPTLFPSAPVASPVPSPTAPTSSSGSCTVGKITGQCKSVSSCGGITMSGYCSGSSTIQCCVLEPTSSTIIHVPAKPSTSGSLGSCKTPQDGFTGSCISMSACTGATFNDLCSGSSSYKCCATETTGVPDLLNDKTMAAQTAHLDLLTFSMFRSLFTGISSTRATALFPYYNYALAEVLMDAKTSSESCYRSAAFAAQVGHESGGLYYFEEVASGAAYEGREDLGNIYPGDGVRYKGRGPIQLTGRYNYAYAEDSIGAPLEADPELVCFPSMGFLTTSDYWMAHNLNKYAGSSSVSSFEALTKAINGGYNGLDDRKNRWYTARSLLGCDTLKGTEEIEQEEESGAVKVSATVIGSVSGLVLALVIVFLAGKRMISRKRSVKIPESEEIGVKNNKKFAANPMFSEEN